MGLIRYILLALIVYFLWNAVRRYFEPLLRQQFQASQASNKDNKGATGRGARGNATQDPYTVLGVPDNASLEEARSAYQKLLNQYHPDRVSNLGPELQEMAEQKTKEINAAYAAIKKSKGR